MRKILLLIVFIFIFLSAASSSQAAEPLRAYFFWGDGCPHCVKEKVYLQSIDADYPDLEIISYEIYHSRENAALLGLVGQKLEEDISGVPFLVIGDKVFVGFSERVTPDRIENRVKQCLAEACPDSIAEVAGFSKIIEDEEIINDEINPEVEVVVVSQDGEEPPAEAGIVSQFEEDDTQIILPLLGSVDSTSFSLPLLTVIMGVLDGFNPCAMWALLFLISLLLGMKDRKRMWILGTAFIMASALVYYVFMVAWLNIILLLGFIIWVRIAIGLLALAGGGYSLKEFFTNKDATCKISGGEQKQKIFQKLKAVATQNSFWLALIGIIGLAFMVNLVELICSAGLPAVYTQILALNDLARWQYYFYILLYIFFFMIDDLLVFFIAMVTLKMTGITTKYARYSRLVGGALMVLIGLLLIFRPEWLMFG